MRILFFLVALLFFIFQAAPAYSQGDADTIACRQNRGSCSFIACSGSLVDIGTCRGGKLKCCKCMSLVPGQNQLMLNLCPY